jgi:CelD/BcsL family acetyltransferase involved in cellulose biosynthesis
MVERRGNTARRRAFSGNEHHRTKIVVEEIRSLDGLAALRQEWAALADRLRVELPFPDFHWMSAWWKNLRRDSRWTRDSLCVLALRRGGRLVAVAPYVVTSRHVLGLPVLRVLQPIGADPNITEIRPLLVAADDECDVVATIVDYAYGFVSADGMVIAGLSAEGPAVTAVATTEDVVGKTGVSMFVLPLPPTWDEFRAALPRNTREALRKCRNSLARDNHEATFRVLDDEREIIGLLPRFFELHRSRADATDTVRHNDVFGRQSARTFVADAIRLFGQAKRARLFAMEIGGAIIAMRLAFVCHDCLYMYYSGYDTDWGKYSVMTSVTAEAIQYAIASGLQRVNLSTGADQSKLRWRPEEVVTQTLVFEKQTIRARVAHQAVKTGKSMREKWEQRQHARAAL